MAGMARRIDGSRPERSVPGSPGRWPASSSGCIASTPRATPGSRGTASGPAGPRRRPRLLAVTSRLVTDVLQALSGMVLVPAAACPARPAWLDGIPESAAARRRPQTDPVTTRAGADELSPWPVDETLPARNALVHLPSSLDGEPRSVPPSPRFFNAFALDYDFVATASEPAEWLDFLDRVWGDDRESIDCLQEWFGYLLTPDTRQQKILMMVGPKRSGRGTIARVLKALVGENNVVNPTLGTLAPAVRPVGADQQAGGDLPRRPPLQPAGQRRDRRVPAVDQRRGRPDDRPQAPGGLDRTAPHPVRADLQRVAPAA